MTKPQKIEVCANNKIASNQLSSYDILTSARALPAAVSCELERPWKCPPACLSQQQVLGLAFVPVSQPSWFQLPTRCNDMGKMYKEKNNKERKIVRK